MDIINAENDSFMMKSNIIVEFYNLHFLLINVLGRGMGSIWKSFGKRKIKKKQIKKLKLLCMYVCNNIQHISG